MQDIDYDKENIDICFEAVDGVETFLLKHIWGSANADRR